MTIGQRTRAARIAAKMTQEQACYWSEVPRAHISDIEQGKHEPRLPTLRRFADAYGVTVSMLIGEELMTIDGLTRKERAVIELMRSEP